MSQEAMYPCHAILNINISYIGYHAWDTMLFSYSLIQFSSIEDIFPATYSLVMISTKLTSVVKPVRSACTLPVGNSHSVGMFFSCQFYCVILGWLQSISNLIPLTAERSAQIEKISWFRKGLNLSAIEHAVAIHIENWFFCIFIC